MNDRSLYACALLLILFSCGGSPSEPNDFPESDFEIFIPNGDSRWMLWQTGVLVEYDKAPIEDSYMIKLELVKDDSLTVDFGDWRSNSGSITVSVQVPDSLGMGGGYRLRMLTAEGDTACSEVFTISGYSLGEFVEVPAGSFLMGSQEGDWSGTAIHTDWLERTGCRVTQAIRIRSVVFRTQYFSLISRKEWIPHSSLYEMWPLSRIETSLFTTTHKQLEPVAET